MKFNYIISIIYLIISFILYPKRKEKLSIICELIYAIALLFCYNTFVAYIHNFFSSQGSLLTYSIINYVSGTILNIVRIRRHQRQELYMNKKELLFILCLTILFGLIGFYRFRGFNVIAYESGDSSIHYRHAYHFSNALSLLNETNSRDLVHNNFSRAMSISYVNGGFMIHLLSFIKPYQAFIIYDSLSYILCCLVFVITLFTIFPKKNYLYLLVLSFFYCGAFALNSFLFGFCYLGLGVMVINLLFLTIQRLSKNDQQDTFFQIILLLIQTFSVFFSYYLFMPSTYLALGLYYIFLWKEKEFSFSKLLLYGFITLIIPFIIGFFHFIYPSFFSSQGSSILSTISLPGYSYDNITPMYFFIFFVVYLVLTNKKNSHKTSYFSLNICVYTAYIILFLILFVLKISERYYFYKLFYPYWIFVIILLGRKIYSKRKYLYILCLLLLGSITLIHLAPSSKLGEFLPKLNIYNWNANSFNDNRILFTKDEKKLMEESVQYKDLCLYQNKFLITGNYMKNLWFYSVTESIPILDYRLNSIQEFYTPNVGFKRWQSLLEYDCLVYFYENRPPSEEIKTYEVLYENKAGAILKKPTSNMKL